MDTAGSARVLMDPAWRRWLLMACLVTLAFGYAAAFFVFLADGSDFIDARSDRAAMQYAVSHPLAVPAELHFGRNQNGTRQLGAGWGAAEDDGIWSEGQSGNLFIATTRCECDLAVTFELGVFTSPRTQANGVGVFVNGKSLGHFDRTDRNAWEPLRLRVAHTLARDGVLRIRLHADQAKSPLSEGSGEDQRVLGIKLSTARMAPAAPEP